MKYSNYIGSVACLALIAICFVPWVYIESIKTTITGLSSEHTNFGHPGIIHIFFSIVAIVLFLIQKIWAKRASLIVCTLNFAWAIRNFILLSRCEMGDCPERKAGIYLMLFLAFVIFVMSLLPKLDVKVENS